MVSAEAFVGSAVTASGGPRDLLAAMALLDVVQAGDVAVIATSNDESGAVFGDIWTAAAQRKGLIAAVTDGLVRDTAGIEQLGMPVFARGKSPNSGHQNGPGEINGPVSVGGMTISPGDIVLGDRDGVVVIPLDQADAVAAALELVVANEADVEQRVAAGELQKLWDEEHFQGRGVHYLD
jgi:regulator of RNase E activity RraA